MKYNKLIRDRIPEIITSKGETPVTRILDDGEFKEMLKQKLSEEVREFLESEDDISELADVIEVIYALADVLGVSKDELERIRVEKQKERGGFKEKIFLVETK